MAHSNDEIRGVLIQAGEHRLLLPNATVAEVLTRAPVEPIAGMPDWLPGRIDWHGWPVPRGGRPGAQLPKQGGRQPLSDLVLQPQEIARDEVPLAGPERSARSWLIQSRRDAHRVAGAQVAASEHGVGLDRAAEQGVRPGVASVLSRID